MLQWCHSSSFSLPLADLACSFSDVAVQRRSYWLLTGDTNKVLVHYLSTGQQQQLQDSSQDSERGVLTSWSPASNEGQSVQQPASPQGMDSSEIQDPAQLLADLLASGGFLPSTVSKHGLLPPQPMVVAPLPPFQPARQHLDQVAWPDQANTVTDLQPEQKLQQPADNCYHWAGGMVNKLGAQGLSSWGASANASSILQGQQQLPAGAADQPPAGAAEDDTFPPKSGARAPDGTSGSTRYRRSTTTKAPRKRTFIANMSKYSPSVLTRPLGSFSDGVGVGGGGGPHKHAGGLAGLASDWSPGNAAPYLPSSQNIMHGPGCLPRHTLSMEHEDAELFALGQDDFTDLFSFSEHGVADLPVLGHTSAEVPHAFGLDTAHTDVSGRRLAGCGACVRVQGGPGDMAGCVAACDFIRVL